MFEKLKEFGKEIKEASEASRYEEEETFATKLALEFLNDEEYGYANVYQKYGSEACKKLIPLTEKYGDYTLEIIGKEKLLKERADKGESDNNDIEEELEKLKHLRHETGKDFKKALVFNIETATKTFNVINEVLGGKKPR